MLKTTALVTAMALAVSGCATASRDVPTSYVSPLQYQSYDCDQLAVESKRLSTRVQQLGGRLDQAASNDQAIMAVTLVLFWPAALALGGTQAQEAEFARLKGEADAIHQAAIARKCSSVMPGSFAHPATAQSVTKAVSQDPVNSYRPTSVQGAPATPSPRPFRPAACDWENVKQGVGACK